MNFSHLVQVNDSRDPSIQPLTRAQLWRGLVKRAESPLYFVYGLDQCEILERRSDSLVRQLRFGNVVVRDRVTFYPPNEVRYDIAGNKEMPGGRLIMRIEEPQPEQFFVRFDYQLDAIAGAEHDYYNEFRKSAYVEADIDTIVAIRELVADGWL